MGAHAVKNAIRRTPITIGRTDFLVNRAPWQVESNRSGKGAYHTASMPRYSHNGPKIHTDVSSSRYSGWAFDLSALIERKIRESDILEYKTAGDKAQDRDKDAAARALAAFANSSCGVLTYRIETKDPDGPDRPTKVVGVGNWTASYLQKHARDGVRSPIPGVEVRGHQPTV